jgi:hypothetical protein
MKLLGAKPASRPVTAEGSLITQLPKRQIHVDKVSSDAGTGAWFNGRVLFISNTEVVIVPTRCRATNLHGAVSRMPRVARAGLPKKTRRGNDKRLTKVVVEVVEYGHKA